MNQAQFDEHHAHLVAKSRDNALKLDARAVELEELGNHAEAARYRRDATMSRREADEQEAAGAGPMPEHLANVRPRRPEWLLYQGTPPHLQTAGKAGG